MGFFSRRSLRERMGQAFLALLLLQTQTGAVLADHSGVPFGSTTCGGTPRNCVSVGDNATHIIYFASVGTGMYNATVNTLNDDYGPTDLNWYSTTYWTIADVIVYDADYGLNGAAGWVDCPASAPQGIQTDGDRWCRNQTLKYNLNAGYGPFWNDAGSRAYLACHEMGHTLGLRHQYGNSCMYPDAPNGPTVLDAIDRSHLNSEY